MAGKNVRVGACRREIWFSGDGGFRQAAVCEPYLPGARSGGTGGGLQRVKQRPTLAADFGFPAFSFKDITPDQKPRLFLIATL